MLSRLVPAKMTRSLLGGVLAAAAGLAMATAPASAHGGGRVFFGFNGFFPPAYYYPPPYFYPPLVYVPAPAFGTVQPLPSQATSGQHCREFQTTVQVDGRWEPGYGTACLQPDGSWRIVK